MPLPEPPRSRASPAAARLLLVAAGLLAALSVPGGAAAQDVRISRARLQSMVVDTAMPTSVAVLGRGGTADTARLVDDLTLSRGEVALVKTGQGPRAILGPLGDLTGRPAGGARPAGPAPSDPSPGRPAAPAADAGERYFATDIRLVTPDATATGVWVLRPIYRIANRMRWVPDGEYFRGALFFAIEDSLRRGESRPLPTPVRLQLLTEADSISPAELAIEHTNFPLVRVELIARRVVDSLRVHLVPEIDVAAGVDIWVPVEPSLEVVTTPTRIQGWGIETARVVVRAIGTTAGRSPVTSLTASSGELDEVEVALGAAGSGSAVLRSAGAGQALLRASAPGLGDATATIEYVWPWVFFLSALLGGLFGGLASAIHERRQQREGRTVEYALKGLIAGILASLVWYALGVNLLQVELGLPRQNELAVFSLAALAGYFGIPRTTSPGEEPA